MSRPRVLLGDDHPLVLSALRSLLESECDVVDTAADGRTLVKVAGQLKPEVVVADISLPLLNGIEAVRQIKKVQPEIKVLFLTMYANVAYLREALAAGATGYILKTSAREELISAVRDAVRNRVHVTPGFGTEIVSEFERHPRRFTSSGSVLSPRQREILQLVAEGWTAKEISELLHVSLQTVAFHKRMIMNKVGLRTVAELTRYAMHEGIISDV